MILRVRIKLFAHLRSYAPQESVRGEWETELPPGARVLECLKTCGLPLELVAVKMKNGLACACDAELAEGDEISLFPPLAGG